MADDKPPELDEASSAKRRRYDRQLRLWGQHGQEAMEDASICLLNGSATGTETLKNLVLPGIGSFTIVDGATVTASDLGNNFFLDDSCVGRPRAQCVTELLQELNEHVSGSYVAEDISEVLSSRPDFFNSFTMVIATQLPAAMLREVASLCRAVKLPLLVVHTYGFLGYLRLDLGDHQVVETHPDHPPSDLRLLHPPAALRALVDQQYADLSSLSDSAFAHTPWAVLIVKAVDEWKAKNGGKLPTAYAQKKEVKAILESYRRPGVQADQNIDEALSAATTALNVLRPSREVLSLLGEARARLSALVGESHAEGSAGAGGATSSSPGLLAARKAQISFYLMAAAVHRFVEEGKAADADSSLGFLPLMGTIPDMTADTATYVSLQQIYAQQASSDVAAVEAAVRDIAQAEGLSADMISDEELKRFCKNAHTLQRIAYSHVSDEYASPPTEAAAQAASDFVNGSIASADPAKGGELYLLLRAARAFRSQRSRWPGEDKASVESDLAQLRMSVGEVSKDLGLPPPSNGASSHVSDDMIAEFCRWGGCEMHAIASVMGGIASQEAIKAATHQYQPLNNTFLFNGANGTTAAAKL